jgi:uncharacterized protein (TIGR02217 family)
MAFVDKFSGSMDLPPTHFMPWHLGVHTESPLFFSRVIKDGAGLQSGFQPRLQGGVPLAGMPLFVGDTGEILLTCKEEIDYALAWFNARRGQWGVFRHRNWMDFKCTQSAESYCYDADLKTQGVTYPFTGDGVEVKFQLLKAYQNPIDSPTYRLIAAVEAGSFSVYLNGVIQPSGWTLDYDTGIVTFTTPVPTGVSITHRCMFDLWVRFKVDAINIEPIGLGQAKIANLEITEVASGQARIQAPLPVLSNELIFNGLDGHVVLKNGPILAALPEWTIRMGLRIDPWTLAQAVLYSEDGVLGTYLAVYYQSNTIGIYTFASMGVDQATSVPLPLDGQYHDIVVTYKENSPTVRTFKVYLGGALLATSNPSFVVNSAIILSQLGRKNNDGGSYLKGSIAALQLFSRELSAVEIAANPCSIVQPAAGLIAGYAFGEGSGGVANSIPLPSTPGLLMQGVTWGNQYTCSP